MPLVPWKYIQERLFLPEISPMEIAKKLTYYGLETKLVEKEGNKYFEFDLLPNRPDLLSWWGIIQEIAIILDCQIKPVSIPNINKSEQKIVEVKIKSRNCHAFSLGLVRNIEIKESSKLVKEWLKINGIQSINNIVDAANLVMLESGQPLHIFDYDSLPEKKELVIRQAQEGEVMVSLQNISLILSSKDIVVSSGEKIIDLAGIIGTRETAVNPQTRNILIECASFCSKAVKITTNRLNFTTSASRYFCRKNSSFSSPECVLRRVISLIVDSCKGNLNSGEIFIYQTAKEEERAVIAITQNFIEKKIGQKISELVIENIWKRLNFSYQKKENLFYVTVPHYRSDIVVQEDLLEELLKFYDYNKIISQLPGSLESGFSIIRDNGNERRKREIRTYLSNCGLQEIISYSLVGTEMIEGFKEFENRAYFELLIPKNEYHKYYRQTLVPSHLKIISHNFSHSNKNLLFFEISSVYTFEEKEELLILSGVGEILNQPFHKLIQKVDFYWIKGILENIFFLWKIEKEIVFSLTSVSFLNSLQSAEIFLNKEKIGFLGRVFPSIAQTYQINEPVFVAQISLTKIFNYLTNFPRIITYKAISNFPISERDLSFLFPEDLDYNRVTEVLKKIGGDELVEISIFDVYQSAEMSKKKQKSVSYHLIFQSPTKTLENKEIEKNIIEISEKIKDLFNAELRVK
jgi:phenylalanyl-tRNA synthetase beta chain